MNIYGEKSLTQNQSTEPENAQRQSGNDFTVGYGSHRPEVIAFGTLQAKANQSPQIKRLSALQQQFNVSADRNHPVMQQKADGRGVIQRYPQQKEESEEYYDPDYPALQLIKKPGYNKFQIKGTSTILYYEPGEGYYTNEALTNKADMSSFVGEREGISNAGGQMYDSRDDSRDGIITIETAKKILERFFQEAPHHREVHQFKVQQILQAFESRTPLPPIQIEPRDGKASLVDGRHRIIASIKQGFKYIPYISSTY